LAPAAITIGRRTLLDRTPLCAHGDGIAAMIRSFRMKGMFEVGVMWNAAGVDETFMLGQQDATKRKYTMSGKLGRARWSALRTSWRRPG
jgi:hypothetical protein